VTGAKIKDGTITGAKVDSTTLGPCEYSGGISAMILRVIGAARTGYSYVTNGTEARRGQFEGDGNVIPTSPQLRRPLVVVVAGHGLLRGVRNGAGGLTTAPTS
jgi:hypothetical protein